MNATSQAEFVAAAQGDAEGAGSIPLNRARLYHFFELAFAHPGEEGFDYFRKDVTEREFLNVYNAVLQDDEALHTRGEASARGFFAKLRSQSYEENEAAHIALFSSNYPHLPCPPYGSLFTAPDSEKRLGEMLAIKEFYQQDGVDIAETFNDLPDHLCVELEFSQLLCFREAEMAQKGDAEVLAGICSRQAVFLDRFLLPLGNSLADLASAAMPENPYSDLLQTMRCFLLRHRGELGPVVGSSSTEQEKPS